MAEYVLTTRRLSKRYKRHLALDEVEMHVPRGGIYGFTGLNGAGKSTLMRVVTGLSRQSSGTIERLAKAPPQRWSAAESTWAP